jgi:hypothetical protein
MPREAVTVYVLIVFLVGTTIEFCYPPTTLDLCKEEGFRQVRDYQEGNIEAKFECETHEAEEEGTEPPAGKDV